MKLVDVKGLLSTALLLLGTLGCSVDTHQRCDDNPSACPTGFYCDGQWCFPDGVGPGRDDLGSSRDAAADVTLRFDMATDGALDASVDAAIAGRVGQPEPADGRLSGTVPGRDSIRVPIADAVEADFALVPVGTVCEFWRRQDLVDGQLVIESDAWAVMFSPEGSFDLCVRVDGVGDTYGTFTVDEVSPTLVGLDLRDGVNLTASEPLSAARLGDPECLGGVELLVDGAMASGPGEVDQMGLALVDLIGNTHCARVVAHRIECPLDSELADAPIPAPVVAGVVIDSTCPVTDEPTGRSCVDCTQLSRDANAYGHLTIVARRPRLALPQTFTTRPGTLLADSQVRGAVRIGPTRLVIADQGLIQIWEQSDGRWQPQAMRGGYDDVVDLGVIIAARNPRVLVTQADGITSIVPVLEDDFGVSINIDAGNTVKQAVDLTRGEDNVRIATLRNDTVVQVHALDATQVLIGEGVSIIAPIDVGARRLLAFGNATVVGVHLLSDLADGRSLTAPVPGSPTCLMAGDWTGDGRDELLACVRDSLHVFAIDSVDGLPDQVRRIDVIPVGQGPFVAGVLGRADAGNSIDAMLLNARGEVSLLINAPGTPVHRLDAPHLVADLYPLGAPGGPLDVGLAHTDRRQLSRWRGLAPDERLGGVFGRSLAVGERVAGTGDLDGDQRADLVVLDQASETVRVHSGGDAPFTRAVALAFEDETRMTAAALGDVNGDGLKDLIAAGEDVDANGNPRGMISSWLGTGQAPAAAITQRFGDPLVGAHIGMWGLLQQDSLFLWSQGVLTVHVLVNGADAPLFGRGPTANIRVVQLGLAAIDALIIVASDSARHVFGLGLLGDENRPAGAMVGTPLRFESAFVDGQRTLFELYTGPMGAELREGDTLRAHGDLLDFNVGDFTANGRQDLLLLVASEAGPRLRLLTRDVAGEYSPNEIPIPLAPNVRGIASDDFDGDGIIDIVLLTRDP